MSNRQKLETAIEKEVYRLVSEVKEAMQDFTVLYLRRNGAEPDQVTLNNVLHAAGLGIEDAYNKNIDRFHKNLDKELKELTQEENPLQHGINEQ